MTGTAENPWPIVVYDVGAEVVIEMPQTNIGKEDMGGALLILADDLCAIAYPDGETVVVDTIPKMLQDSILTSGVALIREVGPNEAYTCYEVTACRERS